MTVIVDLCVVPIGVDVHLAPPIAACEKVLAFWFVQSRPRQWFAKDPAFDALLQQRFQGQTRRAIAGELDAWGEEPTGGLALVLLLDQFPRQIWRDETAPIRQGGSPQVHGESEQCHRRPIAAERQGARALQVQLLTTTHRLTQLV